MRLGFLALAVFVLALGYLIPHMADGVPGAFETYRNALVIVGSLWLVAESFLQTQKLKSLIHNRSATKEHEALTAKEREAASKRHAELSRTHTELTRTRDELVKGRDEAQRERDDLRTRVQRLQDELATAKATVGTASDAEVVSLISLLQQKGRLIDFLMDDITKYPDAQIGAAARVVHQGCSTVLRDYFDIKPVHAAQEGAPLTLDKDYDARRYRLLGRVTGEPPFQGRLLHRGWVTETVKLPELINPESARKGLIAPAEVELN